MNKLKRILYVLLSLCLALSLLPAAALAASTFPDVDEYAEYVEAVEYVKELGIMVGDEQGNFNPNRTVTRAEMAAIICRMMDETQNLTTSSKFSDVPADHWASAYISKAAEMGIVNGYGTGKFGPSDNVTYEQVVTMIIRAVGGELEAQEEGGYPDGYMAVANSNSLLKGVFAEYGEALSRADIAVIIHNCLGGI